MRNAPTEEVISKGQKFCCVIDIENRSRTGKIVSEQEQVEWTYAQERNPRKYSLSNPFNKPDYVVSDSKAQSTFIIRRASLVPSRFELLEGGKEVGKISRGRGVAPRYALAIDGLSPFTFYMPMFSVHFHGRFNDEARVWVIVGPSKMQWNVLFQPDYYDRRLLVCLAFVHYQWYNYG